MKLRHRKVVLLILFALMLSTSITSIALISAQTTDLPDPKYGGTLIIRHRGDPISWNGFINFWSVSTQCHVNVFSRLISVDSERNLIPELAKSWEVTESGKVFTFYLYDNVTWHDGVKFTSADVKWHYETLMRDDVNTYVKPLLQGLESVTTPDDYTVVFRFSSPKQPILFGYFQSDTFIFPKHIYEGTDLETNPANFNPIGTGPFKMVEHVPEQYIIFEANEDYHMGRPFVDTLIYKIIPDATSALLAFEKGEVHFTGPPKEELPRLETMDWVGLRWGTPSAGSHRITFNFREEAITANPWVGDVKVRQALSHAINREVIIDRVQKGLAVPVWSCLSPGAGWAYNPDTILYEYDIDKANELLDEAGYPRGSDGIRFTIPWITYNRDYAIQSSEVIKELFRDIGVGIDIQPVEYVTYVELYEFGDEGMQDYPATYNHMGGWPPEEIGSWIYKDMNMGTYDNPEVVSKLEQAYQETDQDTRQALYYEVQNMVAEDIPFIFLYSTYGASAYNKEFDGWVWGNLRAGGSWIGYRKVFWTKGTDAPPEPVIPVLPEDLEDFEEALAVFSNAVESLSAQVAGLTSQNEAIDTTIDAIQDRLDEIKPTSNNLAYIAIAVSIVAIGLAYYLGTRK